LIPRICDFGYSTISASKDERKTIIVPKSEPWNAPEHTFDRRSFLDAQKMDVYSTALLCLWFLFYSDVSGFETLSVGESHGAIADLQSWSWPGSIEAWKQSGSLGHLISALVKKHVDIEEDLGDELIKCLSSMTTLDPEMRTIDLGPLVDILQERLRVVARNIDVESMLNRDVNDVGLVLSDLVKPDTHQNFEVGHV
jgi:serine/threonine protein kinase